MTDNTKQGTETRAEALLGFLDGGEPPVFEDWGTEALLSGTARATGGPLDPVEYDAPDAGVYDLTTAQGRAAWRDAAPEGVRRTVPEDGEAWLDAVLGSVSEAVWAWMGAEGLA